MRRAVVAALAVLVSVALTAPPASADRDRGHERPPIARTGTVEGAGVFELGTTCTFAWEVVDGSYDTSPRPGVDGTFTLDYCVDITDFTFDGTFTVVTGRGVTLSGTLAGGVNLHVGNPSPVIYELTVTGSTGTRRPITGTITVTGTRGEPGVGGPSTSTIEGTFVTDLRR